MLDGFPKGIDVVAANAFEVGIGHDARRVVAHHAGTMAGSAPFGQETALLEGIRPAFLHLLAHAGVHEVNQWEEGTEGVPEACIGKEIAGQHLSVVRAVVHDFALRVDFVEAAGEEGAAVEAAVEGAQAVNIAVVVHVDDAQHLVPLLASCFCNLFERLITKFLEVLFGLLDADERAGHADVDLFAALREEAHSGCGMLALHLEVLALLAFVGCRSVGKRTVELQDEVVLEAFGYTAAVACRVAHHLVLAWDDLDVGTAVEGIDDDEVLAFGTGEAEDGGTARRGYLRRDVVVGEIYLIIMWLAHLGLVAEPAGSFVLIIDGSVAAFGHDVEHCVVVHPGAWLVGLLEAAYLLGIVGVAPSVAHLAGLWRPEVHAPRQGDGRIGVARGEAMRGVRADEGIDVLHGVVYSVSVYAKECGNGCQKEFFHCVLLFRIF